jgi:hypothetical protein
MEIASYYHEDIKTKEESFMQKGLINIQNSPYTNLSGK